jgi:hypothetical protein
MINASGMVKLGAGEVASTYGVRFSSEVKCSSLKLRECLEEEDHEG